MKTCRLANAPGRLKMKAYYGESGVLIYQHIGVGYYENQPCIDRAAAMTDFPEMSPLTGTRRSQI